MIAWAGFILACVSFCGLVVLLTVCMAVARKLRPYLAMLGLSGPTHGNQGQREQ